MGIFDMGEGDSSFGEGMSELRGGNEARERQELLRMQQAGQQQQSRRQSAGERARAMQEHAANLKKKADQVRKLRNLRYLRCLGCGGCVTTGLPLLVIAISFLVIFAAFDRGITDALRALFPSYDSVVTHVADFFCWITRGC